MGNTGSHRVPCVPYFPRRDCLCSSAGVAALEFPGRAAHTLAHPLPPASPAEVFEETKVSLSTSRRVFPSRKTHGKLRTNRKTGGISNATSNEHFDGLSASSRHNAWFC